MKKIFRAKICALVATSVLTQNKGPGTEAHFWNPPPPLLRRAPMPSPPPPPAKQFSGRPSMNTPRFVYDWPTLCSGPYHFLESIGLNGISPAPPPPSSRNLQNPSAPLQLPARIGVSCSRISQLATEVKENGGKMEKWGKLGGTGGKWGVMGGNGGGGGFGGIVGNC